MVPPVNELIASDTDSDIGGTIYPLSDDQCIVNEKQSISGDGIRLTLGNGVELIDAASGTFNLSLGYSHPKVTAAVSRQLQRCAHVSSAYSAPLAKNVLQKLLKSAPDNLSSGWMRDVIGSTANECAIKIAQKATGKTGVLSFYLSHHGQTVFTTLISGQDFRHQSFPSSLNDNFVKVEPPYCYRCPFGKQYPNCGYVCAEKVNDLVEVKKDEIACIIIEPIFGNGGNIVVPPGFMQKLESMCADNDIVLIVDEVQTGMGRTGEVYASTLYDIEPNIITLAKGLGGIGIPIAAVLMEAHLDSLQQFEHSFTSGGNVLGLAAAEASLDVIDQKQFLAQVKKKGALLGMLLNSLKQKFSCIGDSRGLGLMWGIEIVDVNGDPDTELTNAIIRCAEQQFQLILRGSSYGFGNVIKVRPALIATEDDLVEIVDRLSKAIETISGRI